MAASDAFRRCAVSVRSALVGSEVALRHQKVPWRAGATRHRAALARQGFAARYDGMDEIRRVAEWWLQGRR